jgi:hypothetical protein
MAAPKAMDFGVSLMTRSFAPCSLIRRRIVAPFIDPPNGDVTQTV